MAHLIIVLTGFCPSNNDMYTEKEYIKAGWKGSF